MAIRSREDIVASMRTIIGERDDDEALGFIEDLTDTLDDYDVRVSDSTDWKEKFESNDKEWREKYRERFFEGKSSEKDDVDEVEETDTNTVKSFDDLFKVE